MVLPPNFSPKAQVFHGAFCGRPLTRTAGAEQKDPKWEETILRDGETRFLLFSARKGSTGAAPVLLKERPHQPIIAWQPLESLASLGIDPVGHCCNGVPPIFLGWEGAVAQAKACFALLVDISEEDLVAKCFCHVEGKKLFVAEGMSQLLAIGCEEGDLAIVGHAFAKITWHKTSLYCGACGRETHPIEGGAKRKCSNPECKTRLYARTDPACMAMVRNSDDSKCLLIRLRNKYTANLWTCVSGYAEQCEQVEETGRREVLEETGVEVDFVQRSDWFGSQPWPLGPGGKCELMLAMEFVARSEEVSPNLSEVEDARWFTRDEVSQMLKTIPSKEAKAHVPPFISIAHHLLERWVAREATQPKLPTEPKLPDAKSSPTMMHNAAFFIAGFSFALVSWSVLSRRSR